MSEHIERQVSELWCYKAMPENANGEVEYAVVGFTAGQMHTVCSGIKRKEDAALIAGAAWLYHLACELDHMIPWEHMSFEHGTKMRELLRQSRRQAIPHADTTL